MRLSYTATAALILRVYAGDLGDENNDSYTPSWFWKGKRRKSGQLYNALLPGEQSHMPNFLVTGPETSGTSALIALLGKHSEVMHIGESCWLSYDMEVDENPLRAARLVSRRFEELAAERQRRHCFTSDDEGTQINVRVGTSSFSPAFSSSTLPNRCQPWDPAGSSASKCKNNSTLPPVRVFAEKCASYFHEPFAALKTLGSMTPGFKVVIMVRNPVARACSRYSDNHRGLQEIMALREDGNDSYDGGKVGGRDLLDFVVQSDLANVQRYRACRADHLERLLCRSQNESLPLGVPLFDARSPHPACMDIQLRWGDMSPFDRSRLLEAALYGYDGQRRKQRGVELTAGTPSDGRWFNVNQIESAEWEVLWRCYRPLRSITQNVYPAMYAEHLRRWASLLEVDSEERQLKHGAHRGGGESDGDGERSKEWNLGWGGAGRLMVVHQDDLLERPWATMTKVWEFAGLGRPKARSTNAEGKRHEKDFGGSGSARWCGPTEEAFFAEASAFKATPGEVAAIEAMGAAVRMSGDPQPGVAISLRGLPVDRSGGSVRDGTKTATGAAVLGLEVALPVAAAAPPAILRTDSSWIVNAANGDKSGNGVGVSASEALGSGMTALAYGRARCQASRVSGALLAAVFANSISELCDTEGVDRGWHEVITTTSGNEIDLLPSQSVPVTKSITSGDRDDMAGEPGENLPGAPLKIEGSGTSESAVDAQARTAREVWL